MEKKLKFEVGKKYCLEIDRDNFTIENIENNYIGIRFENKTLRYCVNKDGNIYFRLGFFEELLNSGEITLVEPEKTEK